MTDTSTNRRGRPKGSEIDDGEALAWIAELLVQGQAGTVAAAVRRFAGHDPSLIRRLQRKFRRDRDALLAAARKRIEQAALDQQTWASEIQRVTRPHDWRVEHDPTLRTMDALRLERHERLTKSLHRQRG